MRAELLTSITQIAPDRWNAIVGKNRLICRHEYLRAVEASNINDCRYFYPVIYDGPEIVAHTCAYLIQTELDALARGTVKRAIRAIRSFWASFMMLRSVECGTPVALGSTVSFRNGADREAALEVITGEIEALSRAERIKVIMFRDFHAQELDLFDQLLTHGYGRIHNLPTSRLPLPWPAFEDYLAALRAPYRNKILGRKRKFQQAGGTMELVADFAAYAPEMAVLWRNTYNRAKEYRREVLKTDFFENIDRGLGDRSAALIARLGPRVVGFLLLLFDDETLIPLFSGLDYSCNRETYVYFNLFYEAIAVGIHRQLREMDCGITTMAPKAEIGSEAVPLYMYMKHLSPVLNRFVPRLFDLLAPQPTWPTQRVFRT